MRDTVAARMTVVARERARERHARAGKATQGQIALYGSNEYMISLVSYF